MKEADLKRQIEDWLTLQQNLGNLLWLRLNAGDFIEVRGETRRRVKGCPKGTADLFILKSGLPPMFIELKATGGRMSQEQRDFGAMVFKHGGFYCVMQSLDEVMGILDAD